MAIEVADVPYDPSKPLTSRRVLYNYQLKNVPGFSIICTEVTTPPGGATPPHRHGGASVTAVMLSGKLFNKTNNEPTMLVGPGETWYEAPGCHHRTCANASQTEDVVFLSTFVIETKKFEEGGEASLIQVDDEWKHVMPITK